MSTLIRDATVITMDQPGTVLDPGAILVEEDRITAVGPVEQCLQRTAKPDTVIEARGKVVLPGFVSAHNHVGYAIFRGRAEDLGHSPTHRMYLPMSVVMSREERRELGCLAIAELLRGGTTTILEMEEDADVFAPFIERCGIRASMGVMVHDIDVEKMIRAGETVFDPRVRNQQLEQAIGFAEDIHAKADDRMTAVMTANGLATSSPELLGELRKTADRLGLRTSIHLGSGEMKMVQGIHGKSSFDYARDNGFLDDDVIAVHCYKIDADDVAAFAEAGAHLAHCPLMNQFRGAIAPVQALRDRGVNVGLGIDNYFSDFFDVVRSCIAVARIRADDPEVMQASEALELATMGSARALGMDEHIGSLEKGKKADLQIVDMRRFGLTPVTDPIGTLVYHAHAKDVDTVMVDGKVVVREGRLLSADEEQLIANAAPAADAAWSRFVDRFGSYAVG